MPCMGKFDPAKNIQVKSSGVFVPIGEEGRCFCLARTGSESGRDRWAQMNRASQAVRRSTEDHSAAGGKARGVSHTNCGLLKRLCACLLDFKVRG